CNMYQQRRPSDRCSYYRPPFYAILIGDPHITTLDNVSYTFNGLGEYTILEVFTNNVTSFTMQGRTGIASANASANVTTKATSFIAIVAQQIGDYKVRTRIANGFGRLHFDTNQVSLCFSGSSGLYSNGNIVIKTGLANVAAVFSSGISVNVSGTSGALNFITLLPERFASANTQGLLGVFNNNPKDDFTFKNGTVLSFNGADVPAEAKLYDFATTWKTAANESLFTYNTSAGESWDTFNNNSFMPVFYEDLINQTSPEQLASVNVSCGGQKDCIFDVLSTGNTNFGLATQ
uniref:VWFD domain-containing protein n=1 Tax=Petromyzon marinus TaxID=7757 RepID=S4RE12_PETMA